MNERIRQLAEQAITEKLSIDEFIEALKKEPYDFYGFRVSELQQFAELIVRDIHEYVDGMDTAQVISNGILRRYGIEDRAVPILSADEQALFAGIASSKLFTIAGAKKQFGVEE